MLSDHTGEFFAFKPRANPIVNLAVIFVVSGFGNLELDIFQPPQQAA